jgi:predicted metalloprotease
MDALDSKVAMRADTASGTSAGERGSAGVVVMVLLVVVVVMGVLVVMVMVVALAGGEKIGCLAAVPSYAAAMLLLRSAEGV